MRTSPHRGAEAHKSSTPAGSRTAGARSGSAKRVLALMMACENDKNLARRTLGQVVGFFEEHELDVLVFDDASSSRCGDALAREFQPRIPGKLQTMVANESKGFYRILENTMDMLKAVTSSGQRYDYVVKVDPDVHFCNHLLSQVFEGATLPSRGLFGPVLRMRSRDHVQVLADMLPLGFRRRNRGGIIDHKWEFAGFRKVWWADIGRRALLHGWRGEFAPGSFYVLAWDTLIEMARHGYLDRDHTAMGMVFGDDVVISAMTRSLGHPIVGFRDLVPGWSSELFLREGATAAEIRAKRHAMIHPLKDRSWAHRLRDELTLKPRFVTP